MYVDQKDISDVSRRQEKRESEREKKTEEENLGRAKGRDSRDVK